MKLIKAIETKTFVIELFEDNNQYVVTVENSVGTEVHDRLDYKTAAILFDRAYEQSVGQ